MTMMVFSLVSNFRK